MLKHALLLAALTFCTTPFGVAQTNPTTPPMCTSDQLSFATDSENGYFEGMSHSGMLLVLRNIGSDPCRVEPFPRLTFLAKGAPLAARAEVNSAQFMHPGPVVLPVIVVPGAEVTASVRWVSSEVFTNNLCINPDQLKITIGAGQQTIAFTAHLCGERAKGVLYTITRFAPDPVYKP